VAGGLPCEDVLVAGDHDGLESRVGAKRLHEAVDVIPDGLRAQVKLVRDLIGRTAVLEEVQHFDLARRQVRRRRRRLLVHAYNLAEHADHSVVARERHR
jgi:hypothetical protein